MNTYIITLIICGRDLGAPDSASTTKVVLAATQDKAEEFILEEIQGEIEDNDDIYDPYLDCAPAGPKVHNVYDVYVSSCGTRDRNVVVAS